MFFFVLVVFWLSLGYCLDLTYDVYIRAHVAMNTGLIEDYSV